MAMVRKYLVTNTEEKHNYSRGTTRYVIRNNGVVSSLAQAMKKAAFYRSMGTGTEVSIVMIWHNYLGEQFGARETLKVWRYVPTMSGEGAFWKLTTDTKVGMIPNRYSPGKVGA